MAIVFKSLTTCEHRNTSIHLCMSCSGHFLLDRSQREQLSMRVTQMIDSLLCGGQRGHLSTGTFTLETPSTSPVQFISSILPQIKNHQCLCHFHYKPIAGTARGAKQLLSRKQISSATQQNLPRSLEMDYLSLNTHTPSSVSLFSSQHLLFCDPNYKSQLEGER